MPLDTHLRDLLRRALGPDDEPRLWSDAARVWRRVESLLAGNVVHHADLEALELACYAAQLPMRAHERLPVGRLGVTSLRDRAERAALRLVEEVGERIEPDLLDRTIRLLHETPQRPPVLEDAKLLADALNLDDFGAVGLVRQAIELGLRGRGVDQLADGWEKRAAYGYWEARIKDGFHFPASRALAQARFENARRVAAMLDEEREGVAGEP